MSKLVLPALRNSAYRTILIPTGLVVILSAILAFSNWHASYSFLLGGLVWALPNLYAAFRVFSNVSSRAANKIVRAFYFSMAIKLLITAVFIVAIIKWLPISFGYFFTGYGLALVIFWITSAWQMKD